MKPILQDVSRNMKPRFKARFRLRLDVLRNMPTLLAVRDAFKLAREARASDSVLVNPS